MMELKPGLGGFMPCGQEMDLAYSTAQGPCTGHGFNSIQEKGAFYCHAVPHSNACTPCPHKKGATDFFAITFTNIDGFLSFFVDNLAIEYQSTWCKEFPVKRSFCCYRTVQKSQDTKATHFTHY